MHQAAPLEDCASELGVIVINSSGSPSFNLPTTDPFVHPEDNPVHNSPAIAGVQEIIVLFQIYLM